VFGAVDRTNQRNVLRTQPLHSHDAHRLPAAGQEYLAASFAPTSDPTRHTR
jgi:hypothetical protein